MFDPTILLTPVVTLPVIAVAAAVIVAQWWDKSNTVHNLEADHATDRALLQDSHAQVLAAADAKHKSFVKQSAKCTVDIIVLAEKVMRELHHKATVKAVSHTFDNIAKLEQRTGYSLADTLTDPEALNAMLHTDISDRKSSAKSGEEALMDALFGKGNRPPQYGKPGSATREESDIQLFSLDELEQILGDKPRFAHGGAPQFDPNKVGGGSGLARGEAASVDDYAKDILSRGSADPLTDPLVDETPRGGLDEPRGTTFG
jgi:hypothetical protein